MEVGGCENGLRTEQTSTPARSGNGAPADARGTGMECTERRETPTNYGYGREAVGVGGREGPEGAAATPLIALASRPVMVGGPREGQRSRRGERVRREYEWSARLAMPGGPAPPARRAPCAVHGTVRLGDAASEAAPALLMCRVVVRVLLLGLQAPAPTGPLTGGRPGHRTYAGVPGCVRCPPVAGYELQSARRLSDRNDRPKRDLSCEGLREGEA